MAVPIRRGLLMSETPAPAARDRHDVPWWRDAVVYQVYPRSFADSDGDGTGDLQGVRAHLDHLSALGVDALWLSPFYPSPLCDGGYDVADYIDVDRRFGTLADFDALISDATARDLKVIVDVVPNHCSVEHPAFQAALAAGPGSPEREKFIFRDGHGENPPNNWQSVFGGPAWTRVADGQWYLHLFDPGQPDWNWRHPWVVTMFEDVLRFWLDRGVAGFRIDVAHGLFKDAGLPDVDAADAERMKTAYYHQPELVEHYRSWRSLLASYDGERTAIGEVWVDDPQDWRLYVDPDGLPQLFNFLLLRAGWDADQFRRAIDLALEIMGESPTWVLGSHDAPRQASRYGQRSDAPGPTLAPYTTLGPGAEVDLAAGTRRARAAALLLLALPGSAYIYEGDELALPEVMDIPVRDDPQFARSGGQFLGRDGCRVPVPWEGGHPYGWTNPWLDPPHDWDALTVAAQAADPHSTLCLHREALRIRREHPALGVGSLRWVETPDDGLAFAREPGLLCVVNFGTVDAPLPRHRELLLASGPLGEDGDLPPDTAVWLQLDT
jgi:alpha-glucosidase